MKKNKLNFWLDVVLGLLLLLALVSLGPGEVQRGAPQVQAWYLLHEASGTLLLVLSALHLAWHWEWVKAVVLRARSSAPRARQLPKAVRRNRTVDLWLSGLALPCAATGIIVWLLPGVLPAPLGLALAEWRDVHNWSGMAMFVILAVHLALHWKWLVNTARHCLGGSPMAATPWSASTAKRR